MPRQGFNQSRRRVAQDAQLVPVDLERRLRFEVGVLGPADQLADLDRLRNGQLHVDRSHR